MKASSSASSVSMTACFCTGACKKPPYICAANPINMDGFVDNTWIDPYPYTPWEPTYIPYTPPTVPQEWPVVPPNTGWQCPVCGRGNSPSKLTCDCYLNNVTTTTGSSTASVKINLDYEDDD